MLFNSIDFAVFCPLVFLLYWFIFNKSVKQQNLFIIFASLIFYGWWDWRFLSLLLVSASTDYLVGIKLDQTKGASQRKRLLFISITVNLGLLGFFKYADFFIESFTQAYSLFGTSIHPRLLNIILPVGISFYTFQTLGYVIDVYRKKIPATRDVTSFFAFVSFFPQLVAGPIERAGNLLPQFSSPRTFNEQLASDGLRQILWGLFKKVVVADNCAKFVDQAFGSSDLFSGSSLLIAACLFSIQIYCDFSGYSDIAIGTAKLFGITLRQNFAYPFFSNGFIDFWRRWHISLTSWFRDYVYIPLGGNKGSNNRTVLNIFLVFTLSGLWHGAHWTFVVWGLTNALFFTTEYLLRKGKNTVTTNHTVNPVKVFLTFLAISLTFIFFRSESMNHALNFLDGIFNGSLLSLPAQATMLPIVLSIILLIIEWMGRSDSYAIQNIRIKARPLRWTIYIILFIVMGLLAVEQQQFIYFQF